MRTELEVIMANLALAVQEGELTQEQAVDLLDAFQEHEFEALREKAQKMARRRTPARRRHHVRPMWAIR